MTVFDPFRFGALFRGHGFVWGCGKRRIRCPIGKTSRSQGSAGVKVRDEQGGCFPARRLSSPSPVTLSSQSVLDQAKEYASWVWEKAQEYGAPVLRASKDGAWFAFCATALIAVPVLIEMQREAMLAVEKEQQSAHLEELQRQLAASRQDVSITNTIGALVGAATGGAPAASASSS
jgi:hypothetical protein